MMKIQDFLENDGLKVEDIDSDGLIDDFLDEMEKGLAGRESSLAMIPTYISANRELPANEPVVVIDAGGTNFRVACISFDNSNRAHIEDYSKYPMPGSRSEVSADAYFNQLAEHIQPFLDKSDKIGFCFSYPAEITPDMDGRLIKWTKEMKASEVVGRRIGRGLLTALGSAGIGKRIVLLNDTVATLLAGKTVAGKKHYDSYVGFILGTGTNIAYLEKNKNILKIKSADISGSQAVNVESGGFSGGPRGDIDLRLDRESENPGINRFEKMISGRYLPEIALRALRKAAEEGLLDASCTPWINSLDRLDPDQMDDLIRNGGADTLGAIRLIETDREAIRSIMKAVIERAAKLTAINITATVVKSVGENSDLPICINIDGSTYYKAYGLRESTESYLEVMLGARKISYSLVHAERAPLVGAAIAGLVN